LRGIHKKRYLFFFAALFFLGTLRIYPQVPTPELKASPVFYELASQGHDSDYTWETLAEMALYASSVQYSSTGERKMPEPQTIGSYMQEIRSAVEILQSSLPDDLKERGDYVLKFMHDSFLKSYSTNQTRLDVLLDRGSYNCVSSAVLYMILGVAAGLDVAGVLAPEHAFALVTIGGERIDVEATTKYGFDPGAKQEFHDDFNGMTGFVYVPAENYRQRASLSRVELVSLIFSNRLSDLLKRNRIAETLPLAMDYAVLLSSRETLVSSALFSTPESVVMDALVNYGSALTQQKKYTSALEWAVSIGTRYREESFWNAELWQELYSTTVYNALVILLNEGRTDEARLLLTTQNTQFPLSDYNTLDSLVVLSEVQSLAESVSSADDTAAALAAIDRALQNPSFSRANRQALEQMRTFVLLREGERRAGEFGDRDAISWLEGAVKRYGSNKDITRALGVYRSNRAIGFHNEFAELYNAGKYEKALAIIQQGLAEFPDNRQLKTDLGLAEKAVKE
jgi:tetratricopeptide (TPR) repeat protein